MPIFEYKCKKCNKIFEEFILSSNSTNEIKCPECGNKDVVKLFSNFSSNPSEESPDFDLGSSPYSCPTCSLGDDSSTCK